MDVETRIRVAVAGVALSNPLELTGRFSPLAKTTPMESKILIGVAWADIILCEAGKVLLFMMAAALAGVLIGLVLTARRRRRW